MTAALGAGQRRAGLLIPLSSCWSRSSWGIGDLCDVPALARWMSGAGLSLLQWLPVNEMAPGQRSPYSALSAMAIDPIFVCVPRVPDFAALGGDAALNTALQGTLAHVRSTAGVDYLAIRLLKDRALRSAFTRFMGDEWARGTSRADALKAFIATEGWWLEDYALFRALYHVSDRKDWREWPAGLRERHPRALLDARREHEREVLYRQYLQWVAHEQWREARHAAGDVRIIGDFPFMVAGESADAWAHQRLFSFEGTVGAPPDAFSAEGQDWKLPVYRWDVLHTEAYSWFRERGRRMAGLFDGYRVDHVVGLFRTWVFPADASPPRFVPSDEAAQRMQGEAVLRVLQQSGANVLAEDLGTVPGFVRAILTGLGIPGFRIQRWERRWQEPGRPFIDPVDYPALSLAATGTHDTETLAQWWEALDADERRRVLAIPSLERAGSGQPLSPEEAFSPRVRDALVESLFASGSDLVVVPIQDVFGWTDRINVPAVVDDVNWTWKLRWPVDDLDSEPEARERQTTLRQWTERHRRG
ncbi:MAG: 4-alpha-glucanotransferase [Acidobacteriota bacterium]